MESAVQVFTQLPDAVVKINGIKQLRNYLTNRIESWNNLPVVKFNSVGTEVFVYVLDDERKLKRKFFGYIEDVALNIQRGMYE